MECCSLGFRRFYKFAEALPKRAVLWVKFIHCVTFLLHAVPLCLKRRALEDVVTEHSSYPCFWCALMDSGVDSVELPHRSCKRGLQFSDKFGEVHIFLRRFER